MNRSRRPEQATRQPETQQVSRFNAAWVLCGKFDKSQPAAASASDAVVALAIKTAIIAKSSAIERDMLNLYQYGLIKISANCTQSH